MVKKAQPKACLAAAALGCGDIFQAVFQSKKR